MKHLKYILILAIAITSLQATSQNYKRKNRDLVELNFWKPIGWHLAPGLTYTVPFKPKGDDAPEVDPGGKLAVYLEAGRWHLFPGGGNVFNYYDYSLAFKRLSGTEEYLGLEGSFKQNYLLGNFNINNVIQLSDYTFLQNSLGVNVDFKLSESIESSGSPISDNNTRLTASLHYKFGFGYKATKNMFIIPTLETPILNGWEFENGRSDMGIFSSRYRPLIFSLRIAWLVKNDKGACPPDPRGKNKDGKNYDEMLKME